MSGKNLPTYFLSHGGGPWPFMKEEFGAAFDELEASLKRIPNELGEAPRAVLVISGHWEEKDLAVMASPRPGMVYDYSGFPAHTYHVRYPAPGDPKLAERVKALLGSAGFPVRLDPEQGFDHGTWTVLYPMFPDASIPMVQLSIRRDYDPEAHLAMGRALSVLRSEGVLILGSGLSYHNLRRMDHSAREDSKAFDDWLQETMRIKDPAARSARVREWAKAPSARAAHPREDHLVPLFVALGAAESEPAACVYHEEDFFGGVTASSFRFG